MSVDLSYKSKPDNNNFEGFEGNLGIPYFGNAISIVTDYLDTVEKRIDQYGPMSKLKMVDQTSLMVIGADLYQVIMQDRDQNFSAEMGYISQLGNFYRGGLLLMDFDEHKAQRRMMQSAFRTAALKRYHEMMHPLIVEHVTRWGKEPNFNFYDNIKPLLLEIGAKCFLGLSNVGSDMRHVNDLFLTVNEGLVALVKLNIPITKFGRGKKARDELEAYFKNMIAERRAQGPGGDDMLSQMAHETDENGNLYPIEDVMMHGIFMLFAAHDTTSSALTNMAHQLGVHKDQQARARAEILALPSGTGQLAYDDLEKMEFSGNCFNEVLRLKPPVPMMMRRTLRDFEWQGKLIPANTVLSMPSIVNHRNPEYWTNPDQFDPDRFTPERAEHRKHPYCYHPFGGGLHKCIGYHFAEMLAKSVLREFVLQWDFSTPPNYNPKTEWFPLPKPKDGVPLTLKKAPR